MYNLKDVNALNVGCICNSLFSAMVILNANIYINYARHEATFDVYE